MMYKILLTLLLTINITEWCLSYKIDPIEFEYFEHKFRLSIPNDPEIKSVSFNVNINKKFNSFEAGELVGVVSFPQNRKWSYDFEKVLQDTDILYVWVGVRHDQLVFRINEDPISVEAFKNGKPNFRVTTIGTRIDVTESTTKPTVLVTTNKNCIPTVTEVPNRYGGPYCKNDLIFSDNFDTFNNNYWTNEIFLPPTIPDAEFVIYNGTLGVEDGKLQITAGLNKRDLKRERIDLGTRCTSNKVDSECSLTPKGVITLPPIITGRLSSKNYFNFKYGRVEVRAKLPIGDWLFPLITLQPTTPAYGDHYKSGEMRIAYARGNHNLQWQNKNIDGGRLFGGVILNKDAEQRHQFMKDITIPTVKHFGDHFHIYSLTWTPSELIMAVDGNEYGRITSNFKENLNEQIWNKGEKNAPLDQMFYITLGLSAGGNGDFPRTDDKPWGNTDPRGSFNFYKKRHIWFPTWSQPSLEVDYVRVYAV